MVEEIPVPEDLADAVRAGLQKKTGRQIAALGAERSSERKIFKWLAVGVLILAAGFAVSRVFPVRHSGTSVVPAPPNGPAPASPGVSSAVDAKNPVSGEVAAISPPRPPIAISLHPLHWHLRFGSAGDRDSFRRKLKALGLPLEYESAGCSVLSADSTELPRILELIAFSEKVDGLLARMRELPGFQGKVRISMILETPQPDARDGLHWHLKVSESNLYSVLDGLKEAGFQPVFEKPEFWVFEIRPQEFVTLRSGLLGASGVHVEMRGVVEPPAGSERFPVSFYVEESQSSV